MLGLVCEIQFSFFLSGQIHSRPSAFVTVLLKVTLVSMLTVQLSQALAPGMNSLTGGQLAFVKHY